MAFIAELLHPVVRVEITGLFPECVINSASAAGLSLSEISYGGVYTVRLNVDKSRISALKALCRRGMCELKIIKSSEAAKRLKRRWTLIAALSAALALVILSGFFIWDIEVEGTENTGEVLRALDEAGLRIGSLRFGIDAESVRSLALPQLPDAAWIGLRISGSRAEVQVLERRERPELFSDEEHTDIVAAKSGVVAKMSVLNGEALKKAGETVTEGELLVSGTVGSITAAPRTMRAAAEVEAYTYYELCAVTPAETELKYEKSGVKRRFALVAGKNRINFYLNSGNDIDECDKIVYEYKIGIKGVFSLPVTLVCEKYTRCHVERGECFDIEGMKARLYELLEGSIQGEVLSSGFSVSEHDGLVSVTLRARCLENIASERKYE